MTFEELLDQAIVLLQRRGRLTYRALKRQFDLDDDYLADLKTELIQGQRLAVAANGGKTRSPRPLTPSVSLPMPMRNKTRHFARPWPIHA